MSASPYEGLPVNKWAQKTEELINAHPIPADALVEAVINSWNLIYKSVIGNSIVIGETYFPTPQILGDFIHELVPLELERDYPNFRKGFGNTEKDIHCIKNDFFSIEIKTSSQKGIYGNRSYAQEGARSGKSKSGFYLAVNFPPVHKLETWEPISHIRFGWIDASDWHGQAAQTGQQASLSREVLQNKLITLYHV